MDSRASVQSFPRNLHRICIRPGHRSLLFHFVGKIPTGFHRRSLFPSYQPWRGWKRSFMLTDLPLNSTGCIWQDFGKPWSTAPLTSTRRPITWQVLAKHLKPHLCFIQHCFAWSTAGGKLETSPLILAQIRCHRFQVYLCTSILKKTWQCNLLFKRSSWWEVSLQVSLCEVVEC